MVDFYSNLSLYVFLLLFALLAALFVVALISNLRRRNKKTTYGSTEELIPNCILTRHPILFIPGKRSLFYFADYFNTLPSFLTEHGYEVYKAHLPWSDPEQRKAFLKSLLDRQDRPFHLILTQETWVEFSSILQLHPRRMDVLLIDSLATEIQSKRYRNSTHPRLSLFEFTDNLMWKFHTVITKDNTLPLAVGLMRNSYPEFTAKFEKKLLQKIVQTAENDLITAR